MDQFPLVADNVSAQEITDMAAYDLRAISAYQEIKYRVRPGEVQGPEDRLGHSRETFGSRQEGLQESLINKVQRAAWDGKISILTHRDVMFDL